MSILDVKNQSENRYAPGGRYKHSFIKQVVREVEEGLDVREACERYGIGGKCLRGWLDKYASSSYKRPKLVYSSAVERRSICRAIAEGKLTARQASSTYHVHIKTVYLWQKQQKDELAFSNDLALKKSKKTSTVKLPTEHEDDQVKNLQQQLADANLKIAALNTLIDVAEEQLKINIRKKPGAKQS
jgi:transposase